MNNLIRKAILCTCAVLTILLVVSCENETLDLNATTLVNEEVSLEEGWQQIIYNGKIVNVQKERNHYVLGDQLIPMSSVELVSKGANETATNTERSAILADDNKRWEKGIVRYTFDSGYSNSNTLAAMHHWELFTPIRFVEDNDYSGSVFIYPNTGSNCKASLGFQGEERHSNSLAAGCTVGIMVHEIGHIVGLTHEQNRNDRDDYINVNFENILPNFHSQFTKNEDSGIKTLEFGALDFESVMIYSSSHFSINGAPNSMTKLNGEKIVSKSVLSKNDQRTIASLYREGSPTKVAISSFFNGGLYISSENGGVITANRTKIGAWEKFTILPVGTQMVSFQGNNGKFLSVNETGVLRFNSRKIGVNEKFKITYQSSFARNGEQKFQYFISHAKFSELDVNDITNELSITANNGGQQALFNIEILN